MNKNAYKREISRKFAIALLEHNSAMTLAQIQEQLEMHDEHDNIAGGMSSGRTLWRWRSGKEGAATLETIQYYASLAAQKNMLPSLRSGPLKRADVFGIEELQNRDKKFEEQQRKMMRASNARARAVAALRKYSAALRSLESEEQILVVDNSSKCASDDDRIDHVAEASAERVDALARELESHREYRLF